MKIILDAIQFANKKHVDQTRKSSGLPYVTHPIAVSYLIAAHKQSTRLPEILAAAILHDTLEDTDTTFEELVSNFTPMVASLVLELTNDDEKIKTLGKLEYQKNKMRGMSSYALIIKLADRLHNISDAPSLKMVNDTAELLMYLKTVRVLSKTHFSIISEIDREISEFYKKWV